MCGIVFYDNQGRSRATRDAFRRYQAQQTRGKLGFGCVSVAHKKINKIYRSVDETGIRKILGDKSDMALFHHRMPTSTPNYEECTHPIFVSNELLEYDYYVVHNGVINNPTELKLEFEKLGFVYTTELKEMFKIKDKLYEGAVIKFNDSESLAIDMCIAIEQGNEKIKSKGSVAFVALQVNKDTKMVDTVFFGRNTNPLKMQHIQKVFSLASIGEGEEVEAHKLYAYDTKTKTITKTDLDIGENYKPAASTYLLPSRSSREPDEEDYHPISRVPFRRHYGRNNTQVIKDFPQHNATVDILEAKVLANKRKKEKEIVLSSCHMKNERGVDVMISFNLQGDYLERTDIHIDDIPKIKGYQWDWYGRIMDEMNRNISLKIQHHRAGLVLSENLTLEKIKARAAELKLFTHVVLEQKMTGDEEKKIIKPMMKVM